MAAAILLWTWYQEQKPDVQSGVLEYKMVSGEKDGVFQVIMLETQDRITVLDAAYREIFENNDAEVVTRPEQLQMLENYNNLEYRLGFNQRSNNTKKQYRTSRELFNSIPFGPEIKYEIAGKKPDSLAALRQ